MFAQCASVRYHTKAHLFLNYLSVTAPREAFIMNGVQSLPHPNWCFFLIHLFVVTMRKKTWLSWSSGKDSAWALHVLRQSTEYEVAGLFTTVNTAFQRVAMHAVRIELLHWQAQAAGLPLHLIEIPYPCSHEHYAAAMDNFIAHARDEGVRYMAFGDLFLQDIRRYREENMKGTG